MSQPASIGRVVHFVLGERTWHEVLHEDERSTPPTPDAKGKRTERVVWRTSATRSDEPRVGQWHWPPFVPARPAPPAPEVAPT